MIEMVTAAAADSGKPVGVCGEAAADPLLALVLAGLGISSLSMGPQRSPRLAAALAKWLSRCADARRGQPVIQTRPLLPEKPFARF
jgi:phosphoenolpyruvate-protein phosphotransferase (PTS system enzyme I)